MIANRGQYAFGFTGEVRKRLLAEDGKNKVESEKRRSVPKPTVSTLYNVLYVLVQYRQWFCCSEFGKLYGFVGWSAFWVL